ncbi:hypothetical protein ACFLS1_08805 [Verrucomicrobiota bacterium]
MLFIIVNPDLPTKTGATYNDRKIVYAIEEDIPSLLADKGILMEIKDD